MATGQVPTTRRSSSKVVPSATWLAGFVAVSAWGGAIYLLLGAPGLTAELPEFLPGETWLPGGIALGLIVALPMSIASYLLGMKRVAGGRAAMVAGVLLMSWIIIQVALVGYISLLQPAMFAAGLAVLVLGRLAQGILQR